jgi:hypothetical protein
LRPSGAHRPVTARKFFPEVYCGRTFYEKFQKVEDFRARRARERRHGEDEAQRRKREMNARNRLTEDQMI